MTYPTIPPRLILDNPCPLCGGGYRQDYASGPQLIPHESGCEVYDDILDRLATVIAYSVLLAAIAEYGITPRAVAAAWTAVALTDAIEEDADARPVRDS